MITTNLSDFGYREREMAEELLHEWNQGHLPDDFYNDDVKITMNQFSGFVFLTNSEFQVAMMNGDDLEMWYYCSECGNEGFLEDFDSDSDCIECRRIARQEN